MSATASRLSVKPVTVKTWLDFETLFAAKGSPNYCWCMAWRATSGEAEKAGHSWRKRAMRNRVESGTPVGLLGYLAGEPVAWCSVAPSTTYRRLRSDTEPSEDVWSLVCFFVRKEHRGEGITKALLAAAIEHAKKRGAKVVEGYPVDEDSPSYRFMGFVPLFKAAGFREVGREGTRRHVLRLRVLPSAA